MEDGQAHRPPHRHERDGQHLEGLELTGDSMFQSDAWLSCDGWLDLKNSFREVSGSVCAPRGFKAAAVFCDIKRLGTGKGSEKGKKRDLALIVSDVPAAVAGMFTTNQVCAAPVKISAKRAAQKTARAIVVNSGNANTC